VCASVVFLDGGQFSIIVRSLFDSYSNMVSTASVDELCRSVAAWLDSHCSLVALRPSQWIVFCFFFNDHYVGFFVLFCFLCVMGHR
jgi:hypothetical protein